MRASSYPALAFVFVLLVSLFSFGAVVLFLESKSYSTAQTSLKLMVILM